MLRTVTRAMGRLRLARGRCPACASEKPEGCPVCCGHQAPFPADEGTLRRWAYRFEAGVKAHPAGIPSPAGMWPAADATPPARIR
mgnify:CR=1 FL=1